MIIVTFLLFANKIHHLKGLNKMTRPKVLIVGGGFGGLAAAQGLKKADVDVLLIDKTNHHLFQPLLYQVATAALSPTDIAIPIREILRNQANTTVIMGEVVGIDTTQKTITLGSDQIFSYDYLILAVGGHHSYFGHPEWEIMAPGLKTLVDAETIRNEILLAFEHAESCDDPHEAHTYLRFAIIGGGPTGVEIAGAIAEIARETMFKNFRNIKPEQAEIFLIEGLPQILPMYPEKLRLKAQKELEKLGVQVLTNARVTDLIPNGVVLGDRVIEAHNIIWAAGNQASPLLKKLHTPLDRQGRAIVGKDLSIPGHPEVFVIGDAACVQDAAGKLLPGVAPVAIQQGRYVARIIKANLKPETRYPFFYLDKGQMATIGRAKAVGQVGRLQLSGFIAWLAWSLIHVVYLVNFKSRVMVMFEWLFWYFTGHRNARLIIPQIHEGENDPKR